MILIRNANIVNQGECFKGSLLIKGSRIERIFRDGESLPLPTENGESLPLPTENGESLPLPAENIIDATGKYLLPGIIDDQVHFREPGQTHKACIATESLAALKGGVTTFLDMPNNRPPVTSIEALENKYHLGKENSAVHYGFYLGATNTNIREIMSANKVPCCGVKVFMGSSTGNMLVDDKKALEEIFANSPIVVATHCEEESVIEANLAEARKRYGDNIPAFEHPNIRSREACIKSTKKALDLALKYGTHLHVLHITTAEEVEMIAAAQKISPNITAEVCVHHLWFCDKDYAAFGNLIKCNPAIKTENDRLALQQGVRDGVLKVVATDHAPHTLEEKSSPYLQAPSGLPLIQHSLLMMWELSTKGIFTPAQIVRAMAHNPADIFRIPERGYLKEGFFADICLLDPNRPLLVKTEDLAYRCGWSPLEGHRFPASVAGVFVDGVFNRIDN